MLANHKRLYHLGMEAVAKSTLSEAMNRRNPEIFKAQIEFLGQHREPNKKRGVLRDEIIWYTSFQSVKKYPGELRLMTELTNRIRDTLMQNQSLLEVLSLDRKILEKPPNWNLSVQEELFSPLLL